MNSIIKAVITGALCALSASASASRDEEPNWPVYYYGDPKMRDVSDDALSGITKGGTLKNRYPPETSVLILTGELVSGPDYCVAILRITAQATTPPFAFRSSVGSSHEIFHGVQGACPGDHAKTAARLAAEEFMTRIREEAARR